jgi:hypothetical protein
MTNRTKITAFFLALSVLAFLPALGVQPAYPPLHNEKKSKMVYVCACLKTKSCPCMTEAKSAGPCACGTEGSPPMKAVPADSDWAKENRNALAD